jgi:hypothetical protein
MTYTTTRLVRLARPLVGLALLFVATMWASAHVSHAASRPACSSSGSKTVLATRDARVFTKRGRDRRDRVTRYYGCHYRTDSRRRLGTVGPAGEFSDSVKPIRLAGPFVGYAIHYQGPAGGTYAVVRVMDLRTGRLRFDDQASDAKDFDAQGKVTDLELKPNGSVAWITRTGFESSSPREVRRNDSTGKRTLDTGSDIAAYSLALSDSRLYWSKGGNALSATLR